MGRLKQEFTIDLAGGLYIRACEMEGRALTDDEFMFMCDLYDERICTIDEEDLI